jgi:hypothetical protein
MSRLIATLGGGFLLAILWMDLKFDLMAWTLLREGTPLTPEALATIVSYYAQATLSEQGSFPLISVVMVATLIAVLMQLRSSDPLWQRVLGLLLVFPPVILAAVKIVPEATSLGLDPHTAAEQSALSLSILKAHLYCLASVIAFLALQIYGAYLERK